MQYVVIISTHTEFYTTDGDKRTDVAQQTLNCHSREMAEVLAKALDDALTYGKLYDGRSFHVSAEVGVRHFRRKGSVILTMDELSDLVSLVTSSRGDESTGKPSFAA